MDNVRKMLTELISVSDNAYRTELYKKFHDTIVEVNKDALSRMYANLSGLIAHSELGRNEYRVLKLLLEYLEKILQ